MIVTEDDYCVIVDKFFFNEVIPKRMSLEAAKELADDYNKNRWSFFFGKARPESVSFLLFQEHCKGK